MFRATISFLFIGGGVLVCANDGWLAFGGSPKALRSHPSIQMVSEDIRATIHSDFAYVDCRFTFKNHGNSTSVRMGFPDWDSDDYSEVGPRSTFDWFRSYVDGKAVKTRLIEDSEGLTWQSKTVLFASGQTRGVRDKYRIPLGKLVVYNKTVPVAAIRSTTFLKREQPGGATSSGPR